MKQIRRKKPRINARGASQGKSRVRKQSRFEHLRESKTLGGHRPVQASPSIEQLFNKAHMDETYSTAHQGSQMHPDDMKQFADHLRSVPRMKAKKSAARPVGSKSSRLPKLAKSRRQRKYGY